MKLFLNDASPYARLVRVLLIETGLDKETELALLDPWASPDALLAVNPAAKVPALLLDDGACLIESACIADYLIRRSGRALLSPAAHADAAARLQILGLGRAAIDCAFGGVIQQRFAPGAPLIERWLAALPRIADRLEALYAAKPEAAPCDLADLTVAVAFGYVDFRLPQIAWKTAAPHLAQRLHVLSDRASLRTTRPR
jgi:glutathione S-transferase